MNFIENIFRSPSKHTKNNPNPAKKLHTLSPEKSAAHPKSQSFGEDRNWAEISFDTTFYMQKLIQVKLGQTDIVPRTKEQKSHMVYEICILTSDFQYKLKKRFSLFNQFYYDIKKQVSHLNINFPKKTIIVSGTNIDVVTQRYELLNNFIRKIFTEVKQQKDRFLEFKFLNFLDIDEEYEKRKIKSFTELPKYPIQNNDIFAVEDTSITFELRKLNDYNNHQNEILSRLQNYISYKSYKLSNDEIKTLLVGNQSTNLKGFINLSLFINNEIKALELLRFIIDYLSPQKKSYNDKIYKQFEKLPLQTFYFSYEKIKNNFTIIEFKKMFFILLELYCQNKFFNQTKILQRYPELLNQFELWKNLSEFSQGTISKKATSASHHGFEQLLKKNLINPQKSKSFQIHQKTSETRGETLYPLISAENLGNMIGNSTQSDNRNQKFSFRSNDSTSQLTIEEDWQNCKLKMQLDENQQEEIEQKSNLKMEILKLSDLYCLESNGCNKISIEILKTLKPINECESASINWNKLVYDERHDPFTGISRIYMKLNGKSKIFKFRQEDQKIEKQDQNIVRISKRRLQSQNSICKPGKENIEEMMKMKVNGHVNGFEENILIQNVVTSESESETSTIGNYRRVLIELNFQGEEDYFRTEIMGFTTFLLNSALQAYSE